MKNLLKKRILFVLHYNQEKYMLSRNFSLQEVGDIDWIKKNYNFEKMLRGYEAILVNARPLPKLSVIYQTTQTSRVKVAPWCYVTKSNKIYNDYLYAYTKISKQMRDLLKKDKILQLKQISSSNLLKEIKKLMKQGILVPEN